MVYCLFSDLGSIVTDFEEPFYVLPFSSVSVGMDIYYPFYTVSLFSLKLVNVREIVDSHYSHLEGASNLRRLVCFDGKGLCYLDQFNFPFFLVKSL